MNNGTDMSIIFCEFSLFVNNQCLHNIRIISSIKHSQFIPSIDGETYRQSFMKCSAKFQPNPATT